MYKTTILYMPDVESNYLKIFEARVLRAGEDFVILDQTLFYPQGGGQPSDTGTMTWGKDLTTKVIEVKKKGETVHRLEGPVPPVGETIKGIVDWERRYAHMRMHTAQHLVSAVFNDLFGSNTIGNQIHHDRSRIDFHPAPFEKEGLLKVQEICNEKIASKVPVKIYEEDREALLKGNGHLRVNLDRLPISVRRLRIIEIEDFDVCPCAGTHVRNLSELGGITIIKKESKGKGRVRVTYILDDIH